MKRALFDMIWLPHLPTLTTDGRVYLTFAELSFAPIVAFEAEHTIIPYDRMATYSRKVKV